jgi:hypothetical protein
MARDAITVLFARYVRDLLGWSDASVLIGRENLTRSDFDANIVCVDSLGQDGALASGEVFDGTAEELTYTERLSRVMTCDFYGLDAPANAQRYRLLTRSQTSVELQQALGLTVFHGGPINDVKALTGAQYSNRLQVENRVQYSPSLTVDTLRIDTLVAEVTTERTVIDI